MESFNGIHYPGKSGIQPPRASLTDLKLGSQCDEELCVASHHVVNVVIN